MLTLPIKGCWFRMILRGEKAEEYREIKPYWKTRFITAGLLTPEGYPAGEGEILLANGYGFHEPRARTRVRVSIGRGRPEWGAIPGQVYYILKLLEVFPPQQETEG